MSARLVAGPAGSGKTSLLLAQALDLAHQGKRVWWLGLPNQRSWFYRLAARRGPVLGLEFLTFQQLYYRLLAAGGRLQPLLVGSARLALVAQALARQAGSLPTPGEARLFLDAIAEAKRHGLGPQQLPPGDAELERLRAVYRIYEGLRGPSWDYDDFRIQALSLLRDGELPLEPDALFADGFRELLPLDVAILEQLGRQRPVAYALPAPPDGRHADVVLDPRPIASKVFAAANPIEEARWVLSSLKRDLAAGSAPLDLAVMVPAADFEGILALADEYGVPLVDERPVALADTPAGRILLDLLALPDHPAPSGLLAVPELEELGARALERKVAGHASILKLARASGLEREYQAALARLRVSGATLTWAAGVVDQAIAAARGEFERRPSGEPRQPAAGPLAWSPDPAEFRRIALERAKEAAMLAEDDGFRAWWAALLADQVSRSPGLTGVPLLDDKLASGRRFRRVYVMRAVQGAYGGGEEEDYFVPEELRSTRCTPDESPPRLPRRFRGRDSGLFEELKTRADEVIITYPLADQGGPLEPEPLLVAGLQAGKLADVPSGSPIDTTPVRPYLPAESERVEPHHGPIGVEALRTFHVCPAQHWLLTAAPKPTGPDQWWQRLVAELSAPGRLDDVRLKELARRYPRAGEWLTTQAPLLAGLTTGVELSARDGTVARLDAAARRGDESRLYHFVAPGTVANRQQAYQVVADRWTELWAAGHLLTNYPRQVKSVLVFVWPLLGEPVAAVDGAIRFPWRRILERMEWAASAGEEMRAGLYQPRPGYHCGACPVRDLCRQGLA